MTTSRNTPRIGHNLAVITIALVLLVGSVAVIAGLFRSPPAQADVGYTQNVRAVGEAKYVRTWIDYGPLATYTVCGGRNCTGVAYKPVARGTAKARATTFKVTESIKAYDYYLVDLDVTMSSLSGTASGGTGSFRVQSSGPTLYDRNDSRSIDAKKATCATVNVTMSTPWPIISASASAGHATICNASAGLTRTYSGSDATYSAVRLRDIRHLTMQRWVKVAAGKKPTFNLVIVLPYDYCTRDNADGHCIKHVNGTNTKAIKIGTTG